MYLIQTTVFLVALNIPSPRILNKDEEKYISWKLFKLVLENIIFT